jgi:primosomal protein N' (replication factor Y)
MPSGTTQNIFESADANVPLYAEVIVPIATPQNFTWSVPASLAASIAVGKRVEVNLGNRRRYAGIVKHLHTEAPVGFRPKPVLQVLDNEPIVTTQQLTFWSWVAQYYLCSEGEVMSAALPTHLKLSSETWLRLVDEHNASPAQLDGDDYLLYEALEIKKQLRLEEIRQLLPASSLYASIESLTALGMAELVDSLQEKYASRQEVFIELDARYHAESVLASLLNEKWRAAKQLDLLLAFLQMREAGEPVLRSKLLRDAQASSALLSGLLEKGILQAIKKRVDRIERAEPFLQIDFSLNVQQQTALHGIQTHWQKNDVCLIRGVTGSGKTHLYIQLIAEAIQSGKQVLYLLPEIALTSQIIRRLQTHFGGAVGVYHSRFSGNERVEIWKDVLSGKIRVLLGARSALFLPFQALGLIVCDEEHDASYKQQDPAPRYHARDAAIYLARQHGAKVLLGSATPSLESFYLCQQGKYGYVELTERFGRGEMPALRFVDTRAILKEDRTRVSLTPLLLKKIKESLERKRQVILFQNRRGYSPYQICTVCGWIPRCAHCDVSLTFHKKNNQLRCHYCGTQYPLVNRCTDCGNPRFGQRNFGTERIEEQIQQHFPQARVARMDVDTVRGKESHDRLIRQFEEGEVDILVGTQMVVKGLDFERVDLVGILDADGLLHFADFRANERAFQLMEQVSGRAGRQEAGGEVIVQTADPTHPILQFVERHDYVGFYHTEEKKRADFAYPPHFRMLRILFRHKNAQLAEMAALEFVKNMGAAWRAHLLGPAEPLIARVRDQYRFEVWLRMPRSAKGWTFAKQAAVQSIAHVKKQKAIARVDVVVDVDPVS